MVIVNRAVIFGRVNWHLTVG